MPWCPVCKNEYKEGVSVCADCGTELVDTLKKQEDVFLCCGEEQQMNRLKDYLAYNDITVTMEDSDEEGADKALFVASKKEEIAKRAARIFLLEDQSREAEEKEAEEEAEEVEAEEAEEEEKEEFRQHEGGAYRGSKERAEEFRSSGYVLLIVGVLGFIALVLIDTGVIPIHLNNSIMMNLVMAALFVFFIIFGVLSLRSARIYAASAEKEAELTEEIRKWVNENVTVQKIDETLNMEEAEEILYFKRIERLRSLISDKYMNLGDAFFDNLVEESYQELYDQETEEQEV